MFVQCGSPLAPAAVGDETGAEGVGGGGVGGEGVGEGVGANVASIHRGNTMAKDVYPTVI